MAHQAGAAEIGHEVGLEIDQATRRNVVFQAGAALTVSSSTNNQNRIVRFSYLCGDFLVHQLVQPAQPSRTDRMGWVGGLTKQSDGGQQFFVRAVADLTAGDEHLPVPASEAMLTMKSWSGVGSDLPAASAEADQVFMITDR